MVLFGYASVCIRCLRQSCRLRVCLYRNHINILRIKVLLLGIGRLIFRRLLRQDLLYIINRRPLDGLLPQSELLQELKVGVGMVSDGDFRISRHRNAFAAKGAVRKAVEKDLVLAESANGVHGNRLPAHRRFQRALLCHHIAASNLYKQDLIQIRL